MNLETTSLIILHLESKRLSKIVSQRISLSKRIGFGEIKFGSGAEATRRVRQARQTVKTSLQRAREKLGVVNQVLGHRADEYLFWTHYRRTRIERMQVDGGYSEPEKLLQQQEYEALLPLEKNRHLQAGIRRLRVEDISLQEERKKKKTFELPGGIIVTGKKAELLTLLFQASEDTPVASDYLIHYVYFGIEEKKARERLGVLLSAVRKDVAGQGLSIVNTVRRTRGGKGVYYLRREDKV